MSSKQPLPPSTVYLDYMEEGIAKRKIEAERLLATAEGAVADYPGQTVMWRDIQEKGERLRDDLRDLAFDLHDHPEEAFEEFHACERIVDKLSSHGFAVATAVYGVETALEASWATSGFDAERHPTIAILAEYDALPEIGHACGHNIIAAAGVGAFLAATATLRDMELKGLDHLGFEGRLVLLGTPAEEGHSGKEYMIAGGAFDGVDAAIMMHPFAYDLAEHIWVGRRTMTATFHGVSAHASAHPYMGRNALDAASLAYQGLGVLRQQMPPSDRLHAIITEGGNRPSVIPDAATMAIYVRSLLPDALVDLSARVNDVMEGAARMAGVGLELDWDIHPASLPVRNNHVLAGRWARTQQLRGRTALPEGILPDTLAASTDFGNVSHIIPGIHPMVKISPENVALHTKEFAEYSRTEDAVDAAVDSAIGLAQVAVDALADPMLLTAARAEFEASGGVLKVANYLE
ncbi:p-aminobenzoyl-glutamate hydrolase subunit B [Corynebacterium faecale]|uniref:M20 family metallopeptidase n=1 Tax=Corynebacterium faecale TaxID=1758466 RepID=UPI0025B5F415|nr:M20 family metallopeptidase [Corynebacterium faecale]WJY90954.1 p-aminobenzoyl-glutamate hydrolase subunit B [Corynebacterium faecale]